MQILLLFLLVLWVLKRLKKFLLLSLLMNLKEVDMNVELER